MERAVCPAGFSVVTCSVPDGDGSVVASVRAIRHGSLSTQEGSCMHVDSIRTLASSITFLEEQIVIVEEFESHN